MTRPIEDIARVYLLHDFRHSNYSFLDKKLGDEGFDLWMKDEEKKSAMKVELKAHTGTYKRPSNLVERLIFNAEAERKLFENGETVIVRVFLGTKPYRVFIITNSILSSGAELKAEARYVLRGRINYAESFTDISTPKG